MDIIAPSDVVSIVVSGQYMMATAMTTRQNYQQKLTDLYEEM